MMKGESSVLDQILKTRFNLHVSEGVEIWDLLKEQAKMDSLCLLPTSKNGSRRLQYQYQYSEEWLCQVEIWFTISCDVWREIVSKNMASAYVDESHKLASDEHLSSEQMYIADKTDLFWRCTSKRPITRKNAESP